MSDLLFHKNQDRSFIIKSKSSSTYSIICISPVFKYAGGDEELTFRDKIARDLHGIAQTDVLIRSQSYFSRTAEIMGDHKLIIYPLEAQWHGPMLIMRKIVIKGSFDALRKLAYEKSKL